MGVGIRSFGKLPTAQTEKGSRDKQQISYTGRSHEPYAELVQFPRFNKANIWPRRKDKSLTSVNNSVAGHLYFIHVSEAKNSMTGHAAVAVFGMRDIALGPGVARNHYECLPKASTYARLQPLRRERVGYPDDNPRT
jgi:hypothetical protein